MPHPNAPRINPPWPIACALCRRRSPAYPGIGDSQVPIACSLSRQLIGGSSLYSSKLVRVPRAVASRSLPGGATLRLGRAPGRGAVERTAIASGMRKRGDYEVLALLRQVEPALLTPIEVARQLVTSQSGMTGKLDQLERPGFHPTHPGCRHRRAIRLGITDSGHALIIKPSPPAWRSTSPC